MTEEIIIFEQDGNIVGITKEGKYFESYKTTRNVAILRGAGLYIERLEQENRELKAYKDVNEDFKKAWDELNKKYTEVLKLAKENADSNEYCLQELEKENEELKKQIESQKGLITVGGKQQYKYLQEIDKLQQENKELKEENIKVKKEFNNLIAEIISDIEYTGEIACNGESPKEHLKKCQKALKALEEILESAKFAQCLPCGSGNLEDCINCNDDTTNNGQFCMEKRIHEIKTKCVEVLKYSEE